jgi:8-oxo-dGTP diphosphatase
MPNQDDSQPRVIRKVALASFKDGKIMQVRDNKNTEVFIAPGGKVEQGESDAECLERELKEELKVALDPKSLSFLCEFNGPAHGHPANVSLNIRFYQAKLIGKPSPNEEIVEISYFDSSSDPKHLSEIARTQIFPWLKEHGYIN